MNIIKNLKLIKKNTGAFSIIAVILIFLSVITITAYLDMLSKTYITNEVQSIMDATGDSTLKQIINDEAIRDGRLCVGNSYIDIETGKQSVDMSDLNSRINTQYNSLIAESIHSGKNITYFSIVERKVYMENTAWGLGVTKKSRPQLILDTVAKVRIRTSNYFNTVGAIEKNFYNSKDGYSFNVKYNGKTAKGETELIVRSVNRVVLR